MTELKEALKPCPFCGGEAESNPRTYADAEADVGNTYVNCIRCGIETPWRLTEAEAIAAWNTRADASENAALREKLAEMERALEPFAEVAEYAAFLEAKDGDYIDVAPFTAGQYRAARLALTGGDNAEG